MLNNTSKLKKLINEALISECGCQEEPEVAKSSEKEPFYYLAPDVIGSINNMTTHPEKDIVSLGFDTTDGKKFSLVIPNQTMYNWMDGNDEQGKDGNALDFVKAFFGSAKPSDEQGGEEMLGEIVDEDGNIIGADDKPKNANFKLVGVGNTKDSDSAIKQIIPKSKRFYGDMGLGFVTW